MDEANPNPYRPAAAIEDLPSESPIDDTAEADFAGGVRVVWLIGWVTGALVYGIGTFAIESKSDPLLTWQPMVFPIGFFVSIAASISLLPDLVRDLGKRFFSAFVYAIAGSLMFALVAIPTEFVFGSIIESILALEYGQWSSVGGYVITMFLVSFEFAAISFTLATQVRSNLREKVLLQNKS